MRDIARVAALVVALLVVARDIVVAGNPPAMVTASGLVVFVVVGALTLWRDGLVTFSGLALAAHYVGSLVYGDVAIDLAAPVVGALVVVYLDLADLATSLPRDRRVDRRFARATVRRTFGILGVGVVAGAGTFVLGAAPWPSAEWVRAAGALGVAAVIVVPLILLRRAQ